jgi:hypothetical protein
LDHCFFLILGWTEKFQTAAKYHMKSDSADFIPSEMAARVNLYEMGRQIRVLSKFILSVEFGLFLVENCEALGKNEIDFVLKSWQSERRCRYVERTRQDSERSACDRETTTFQDENEKVRSLLQTRRTWYTYRRLNQSRRSVIASPWSLDRH